MRGLKKQTQKWTYGHRESMKESAKGRFFEKAGTKQVQAGTKQEQQGQNRDSREKQGQNRDKQGLILAIPSNRHHL